METNYAAIIFVLALAVTVIVAVNKFIRSHILGTFKYDNSGATYRCMLEFDDLDDVEKHSFAIVKIREADLNLPGEKKSHNRQPL